MEEAPPAAPEPPLPAPPRKKPAAPLPATGITIGGMPSSQEGGSGGEAIAAVVIASAAGKAERGKVAKTKGEGGASGGGGPAGELAADVAPKAGPRKAGAGNKAAKPAAPPGSNLLPAGDASQEIKAVETGSPAVGGAAKAVGGGGGAKRARAAVEGPIDASGEVGLVKKKVRGGRGDERGGTCLVCALI